MKRRAGRGEAPGKAILFGEHFVVHGCPALAVPITSRSVHVRVSFAPGPWRCPSGGEEHLRRMVRHLGVDPDTVTVEVGGNLPVGAGLGSSASLAVALVRALGSSDAQDVRKQAHELERLAHGDPSGIDDLVAASGESVWFRPGQPPRTLGPVDAPLWVGLTPAGPPTRVAVSKVAGYRNRHPREFEQLAARSTAICVQARHALAHSDWPGLGQLMNESHELLRRIGVSTPLLDGIVAAATRAGAWGAKLTGAGLGGAFLVLAPEGLKVEHILADSGATEVFRV